MARHRRAHASQLTKSPIAKAGKRSGRITLTEPNEQKAERSLFGEKQFELRRPATVEVPNLMGRIRAVTVPFAWDPGRGHITFSPRKAAK